jgi:hypothetical protein
MRLTPASYRPDGIIIHTLSRQAIGDLKQAHNSAALVSFTYPAASRVLAYPFEIANPYLVYKLFWLNGTTATTDSADVGIYNEAGTSRLVSAGSTAIATANAVQEVDVADTLLVPGRYWMAYIQGGVTATPLGWSAAAVHMRCMGYAQQAGSGSTLGSTFTPAAVTGTGMVMCGLAARTQVA